MAVTYRLTVFDVGGSNPRLQWETPDGLVQERPLDQDEMSRLIELTKHEYAADQPAVVNLGHQLFRWIDGPADRWLSAALEQQEPLRLHIAPDECLRGLPWEILYSEDAGFLCVNPTTTLTPIHRISRRRPTVRPVAPRPPRIAFLAAAPLHVEPVLDFEAEEALLLAAANGGIHVVVEESGSLEGLKALFGWFGTIGNEEGASFFDVLHLSGHVRITPDGPRFVMESETGHAVDVTAQEIADAVGGKWPGMVFLTGCQTAQAGPNGATASMAATLITAGADAVIGWALPVGDHTASKLAATLYGDIATGATIPAAATTARRGLYGEDNTHWHHLRLYSSRDVPGPLVTAPGHPNYQLTTTRRASTQFRDSAGNTKVADYGAFVGRRRDLQGLLKTLRPVNPVNGKALVKVTGMGGLGKSTLAARLVQRLEPYRYRPAVWSGKIAPTSLRDLSRLLGLPPDSAKAANKLLNDSEVELQDQLRYLLRPEGPLAAAPCVFIFDDFEDGNLKTDSVGKYHCTPEALAVLTSFAKAITDTGSQSRIIVASRYDFPLPGHISSHTWPINPLLGHDLDKKLRLTEHLGPDSTFDAEVKKRAIIAAAGIPRLIERLDALLATHTAADTRTVLTAIETTQIEYREELLLDKLVSASPPSVRRLLGLLSVYEIPVPLKAILPLDPDTDLNADLKEAVQTGLAHAGIHPGTGEMHYLVSPLVRPHLTNNSEALTPSEIMTAQKRAASTLKELLVTQ